MNKLEIGDKITKIDGVVRYINREQNLKDWNKGELAKIERYVEHHKVYSVEELPKTFYTLETIWERKEILTEKEYLRAVIEPFRDKVIFIKLQEFDEGNFLTIYYDETQYFSNNINFPYFEKGKHYKGLELDKEYRLEDLGL